MIMSAQKSFEPLKTSFLAVAMTELAAIDMEKWTKECFTGPQWVDRNQDIDDWLPITQPKTAACVITTLAPSHRWTFVEAATAVLGIHTNTESVRIGKLLIRQGNTLTLAQLEKMAEGAKAMKDDEYADMRVDGELNFAFVETKSAHNPVVIIRLCRRALGWEGGVIRLDDRAHQCTNSRLLVGNLALRH